MPSKMVEGGGVRRLGLAAKSKTLIVVMKPIADQDKKLEAHEEKGYSPCKSNGF